MHSFKIAQHILHIVQIEKSCTTLPPSCINFCSVVFQLLCRHRQDQKEYGALLLQSHAGNNKASSIIADRYRSCLSVHRRKVLHRVYFRLQYCVSWNYTGGQTIRIKPKVHLEKGLKGAWKGLRIFWQDIVNNQCMLLKI